MKDCIDCDNYEKHKNLPDSFYCSCHARYFDWDETGACDRFKNSLEDEEVTNE